MRMPKPLPDQAYLRKILDYDSVSGKLYWKLRLLEDFPSNAGRPQATLFNVWNGKNAGKEAFTSVSSAGYLEGSINGVNYLAHRVAYKWVYGVEPTVVDHDDRNTLNNRIRNLIDGSQKSNMRNRKISKNNSSGFNGVCFCKRTQRWNARITVGGVQKSLGYFDSASEAGAARDTANKANNYHPNHGK